MLVGGDSGYKLNGAYCIYGQVEGDQRPLWALAFPCVTTFKEPDRVLRTLSVVSGAISSSHFLCVFRALAALQGSQVQRETWDRLVFQDFKVRQ